MNYSIKTLEIERAKIEGMLKEYRICDLHPQYTETRQQKEEREYFEKAVQDLDHSIEILKQQITKDGSSFVRPRYAIGL